MDVPMTLLQCAECGMPFAIPTDRVERLKKCHNTFYCPTQGHPQSFTGKSDADKLRESLDEKQRQLDAVTRERDRLARAKKRKAAKK